MVHIIFVVPDVRCHDFIAGPQGVAAIISLFAAPAPISRSRCRSTILVEHGESCVLTFEICKVIPSILGCGIIHMHFLRFVVAPSSLPLPRCAPAHRCIRVPTPRQHATLPRSAHTSAGICDALNDHHATVTAHSGDVVAAGRAWPGPTRQQCGHADTRSARRWLCRPTPVSRLDILNPR